MCSLKQFMGNPSKAITQTPLYVAIQGAAKNATLAACTREGVIHALIAVGPLGIRVNADFNHALFSAFSELSHALGYGSICELARNTESLCVAMSGVFQECDEFAVRQTLESIKFQSSQHTVICEDVWAALAAEETDTGAVILACTGSNVFIRNKESHYITVGGWGSELADLGGGFHVGKLAIARVFDYVDRRHRVSAAFVEAILSFLELQTPTQLVPWYHEVRRTSFWRSQIADLAIVVTKLAERDADSTAKAIISSASSELVNSMQAGLKRAAVEGILREADPFPVILSGGLGLASLTYRNRITQGLISLVTGKSPSGDSWPSWSFSLAKHHPIAGALAFALSGTRNFPSQTTLRRILTDPHMMEFQQKKS